MSSIQEKVIQIVVEQLSVEEEQVTPTASFIEQLERLLDIVEMVMALETAFEIEIPDEDAEKITNVQEAVDYLEKKLAAV